MHIVSITQQHITVNDFSQMLLSQNSSVQQPTILKINYIYHWTRRNSCTNFPTKNHQKCTKNFFRRRVLIFIKPDLLIWKS